MAVGKTETANPALLTWVLGLWARIRAVFSAIAVALPFALSSAPAPSQTQPSGEAITEIAAHSRLLAQFDTIARLSEELVFWQSVAILGAQNGWEFSYNTQGTQPWPWTLRLYNALDETQIEIVRASQAISRSGAATEADRAAAATLMSQHERLRDLSGEIHALLLDDRTADAAALYEEHTIELRRDLANQAYSASEEIRRRANRIALEARLE